jgi:hypothetical protein
LPHSPHEVPSLSRLTQDPPQSTRPPWHTHCPPTQLAPAAQACPQAPQCLTFEARSTHAPPQSAWSLRQLGWAVAAPPPLPPPAPPQSAPPAPPDPWVAFNPPGSSASPQPDDAARAPKYASDTTRDEGFMGHQTPELHPAGHLSSRAPQRAVCTARQCETCVTLAVSRYGPVRQPHRAAVPRSPSQSAAEPLWAPLRGAPRPAGAAGKRSRPGTRHGGAQRCGRAPCIGKRHGRPPARAALLQSLPGPSRPSSKGQGACRNQVEAVLCSQTPLPVGPRTRKGPPRT